MFNPGGVWLALLALPVSALTVWLVSRGRTARIALDHPNQRSLHTTPIPRTGGLGVVAGVAAGWAAADGTLPVALWGGAALLAVLSFADDRYGLPTSVRFLAHIVAAVWLVAALGTGWNPWLWPLAVAAIVWMTNLYNFMDGSDGLAGGMALFGFGFFAIAAATHGQSELALATLTVAAAALGFLAFNLPPARVFMGDTGSISLGFLAAGLGMLGAVHDAWPAWFPVLVFLPFIADATATLLRRGWRGEKVWHAHKEHYYQRLIRMGWSHRQTALAEYAVMGGSGGMALVTLSAPTSIAILIAVLWGAVLITLMWLVDSRWRDFQVNQAITQA
ncbi:glycosyl transferase [Sulfuriferula plumbiphila]|uniref:Glycosyl transferase n=1 Tax=Sulfuriferula plumbiphila TaxID=171865 RepID=A0A512L9Z9_9PROT|nr:glycosyltransferase family 4 protein [Sulfuriferula plumbiphila]BBP05734.1 glycosyl transferase [Sulfuriferula plumbiphila]GEP31304.1 glycosyl transferase [Sulfuriferula plumbiphila]